ncbi:MULTISPECIES: tyrosine-type recombinase/integrase [unclassified Variovorax]|uniref:tyrosine-type recombinase/integrase n=1 Tax=unclassified Variovorax TaxID=663243 RepID=UPI0013A5917D|nr:MULTISPECIES: tyrosine-type recombinase/integrase [unclassified Variovorax]
MDELLEAYRVHRGSLRHRERTVTLEEGIIFDFMRHAQCPPGHTQPHHFEQWGDSLFQQRGVSAGTQRRYQSSVRLFYDYVGREPRLRQRVRDVTGQELVQVATPENCIVHVRVRELEADSSRRSFTDDETQALIERMDLEIRLAHQQRSKALKALRRDKVVFCTVLELGLRAAEVLGLNIDSFERNPKHPKMGRFGLVRVYGKGGVWRSVPILNPDLSRLLQWYLDEVRPDFLGNAANGEKALFLSEQGKRLSYSALYRSFVRMRRLAGLSEELVMHCLRHTSVSNNTMLGLSSESVRLRHGHRHQATTQGYTHFPDKFVQKDFSKVIKRNLKERDDGDSD